MTYHDQRYDDILDLADRLHKRSIPHYLCQDRDGWTIIIYQSTGVLFGKRAMMFSQYTGSKGYKEGLIEVYVGDETMSFYRDRQVLDEHWFTKDFDECYSMIIDWYTKRYNDICGE